MEYQKQAEDFAKKYGVTLKILGCEYKKYFDGDDQPRYVFKLKLSRKVDGKTVSYTFEFGQSIVNGSEEPTIYDVIVCMTKYDPETFEDFCMTYGYDTDSRKAEKVYRAVCKEWKAIEKLFGDCMEELQEIV